MFFLWLLVPVALHRIVSRLVIWWSWHVLIAGVCYRHCFKSEKGTAVSHVTTTERRSSGFCFAFFLLLASFQYYHVSPLKSQSKAGVKSKAALYSSPDNTATPSWLCDASAFYVLRGYFGNFLFLSLGYNCKVTPGSFFFLFFFFLL